MEYLSDTNGLLYDGLRAADTLLAKALGVGYAAQIRLIEKRLYEYLNREWNDLAEESAKKAAEAIAKGAGRVVLEGDVEAALKIVDYTMGQWAPRVLSRFTSDMREVYELGRHSGSKKVSVAKAEKPRVTTWIKPSFDLVDSKVVEAYGNHQAFWIGRFYNEDISATVSAISLNQVRTGEGRIKAGKMMDSVARRALKNVRVPDGFKGSTSQYFEGLVANATTVERTTGHLRSFAEAGYSVYSISNPIDHRTCERCRLMHGKQFRVSDGLNQVGKVITSPTPNDVRKVHPWLTPASALRLTKGKMGAATPQQTEALRKAGHAMPTFHYFCRCDIDIIERAKPGAPIDSDLPPIKTPTPRVPKPKKKPDFSGFQVFKPVEAPPPQVTPPTPTAPVTDRFVRPGLPPPDKLKERTRKTYQTFRDDMSGEGRRLFERYRDRVHDDLALWGADVTDEYYRGIFTANKEYMGSAAGMHFPDGTIIVETEEMNNIYSSYHSILRGEFESKSIQHAHTVYHEVMHGANRIRNTVQNSAGRFLQEITNDTAARRVVLDIAGKTSHPTFSTAWGGYQPEFLDFYKVLVKHTKWKFREASEIMDHVSLAMQSKAAKYVSEDGEIIDELIRHMRHKKEMSDAVAKNLKEDLLKCRIKERKPHGT